MSSLHSLELGTVRLTNRFRSERLQPQSNCPSSRHLRISTLGHGFSRSANANTSQGAYLNLRMLRSAFHAAEGNPHSNSGQSQKPKSPFWKNWIFGWLLSVILPMAGLKGGNVLRLAAPLKQIEKIAEEVEEVAEIVEEVAEEVEKISSAVAENAADNEMLKETAVAVEQVSKEVEKDAKLAMEFMHKVEEIKEEAEKEIKMVLQVKSQGREGKATGGGKAAP